MTETTDTAQSQEAQEKAILLALPELLCSNCGANILEHHGFFNYCLETSPVCEHSYLMVHSGCIYVEHDEDRLDTESHECSMEAYCAECKQKLPWSVSDLRQLDGVVAEQAEEIIARLISEFQEQRSEEVHASPTAIPNERKNHKEDQNP